MSIRTKTVLLMNPRAINKLEWKIKVIGERAKHTKILQQVKMGYNCNLQIKIEDDKLIIQLSGFLTHILWCAKEPG